MAKPSPAPSALGHLLVLELWGLGDLALAMPFLRQASAITRVTLLAKPHAAPLLHTFAPAVELLPLVAPWTAFRGKYRLHRWPWTALRSTVRSLRAQHLDTGVSARPDPRDHMLLALAGVRRRIGFPRWSSALLTQSLARPALPHRAAQWQALAAALGLPLESAAPPERRGRRLVIHTGAGQPLRMWPRERFDALALRLRTAGWEVEVLDSGLTDLDQLLVKLAHADRFIGNDSGPGHIAALLGVPTFTIFGPQLPELFVPQHPLAGWIEGAPCLHKPCFDACRYPEPHCIRHLDLETVTARVQTWLDTAARVTS